MERLTTITLQPSRMAFYLHRAILLLSLLALWLCGLSWWWKVAISAALLAAALFYEKKWHETKHKQLPVSALGCEQAQWWVLVGDDKRLVELVGAQVVLSWLVVLSMREKNSGKKYALALWPDMACGEDLRRLRVWLRNR